ncbi:MAG: hypothetical protein CMJ80_06405 [Planctomycetaceae bacterium]|nr:hypothetical protein [Planctomycetaceae bacterium]
MVVWWRNNRVFTSQKWNPLRYFPDSSFLTRLDFKPDPTWVYRMSSVARPLFLAPGLDGLSTIPTGFEILGVRLILVQ